MTTSWGGTSLPDPISVNVVDASSGAQFETIDGALHTDIRRNELQLQIDWGWVSYTVFGQILSKALTFTSSTFITEIYAESPGLTVVPILRSLNSSTVGGASGEVRVSCAVRTVT